MSTPFRTGLIVPECYWGRRTELAYQGKGWSALISRPSSSVYTCPLNANEKEVFIQAVSQDVAQKALDLVCHALSLFSGGAAVTSFLLAWNDEWVYDLPMRNHMELAHAIGVRVSTSHIPEACELAARASFRRKYVYALAKYQYSVQQWATHVMDLEPGMYFPKQARPYLHVVLCQAIICAYSVIEELGLDVRATPQKPSFENKAWNPEVKADLEKRLKAAHIDLKEKVVWIARGTRRLPEKKRPPRISQSTKWSGGNVRDGYMEVVDAIAYASWLRSKVAAHRLGPLAASLSTYDVANVQGFVCRLLLETLGA